MRRTDLGGNLHIAIDALPLLETLAGAERFTVNLLHNLANCLKMPLLPGDPVPRPARSSDVRPASGRFPG